MSLERLSLMPVTCRNDAGCEFRLELTADLPSVRGDRAQLVQLFDNLISNAVRYGCDKPGAELSITAERNGAWVMLKVTDQALASPASICPA